MKCVARSTPKYLGLISKNETQCPECSAELDITENIESFEVEGADYDTHELQPNQFKRYHTVYEYTKVKHYWCFNCMYRNCERCGVKEAVRLVKETVFHCDNCRKEIWMNELVQKYNKKITLGEAQEIGVECLRNILLSRHLKGVYHLKKEQMINLLLNTNAKE